MQEEKPSAPRIVRFGVFEVDLRAGELRKGGVKVKLQEQPFQILALLLERPGEVVTREELKQKLWPADTFVDFEHSINAAVKRLREALDDSADTPRFVETLPRRGYRFIYPVEGQELAVPALRRRPRWVPALALVALPGLLALLLALNVGGLRDRLLGRPAPREITSIAVLPLENLSRDPQQDYFADGMTEALITELGKISALRVISRQSVMQYKNTKKPMAQIAQELKVDAVVEGAVVREGERVRVTAQLIQMRPERQLWAERYERDLTSILVLQSEVAQAIAREIGAKLTPQEQVRLARARPVNPEAYDAYLRGFTHMLKATPKGIETALDYFQLALEKDPNYAPAYAGIGGVWTSRAHLGFLPPHEAWAKAKAALLKALELDDTSADAHYILAFVLWSDWDWAASEREFRRAIELNPNNAIARSLYCLLLNVMGRAQEGRIQIERALELDPYSPHRQTILGNQLLSERRYDEALAQYLNVVTVQPDNLYAHDRLWGGFHEKGRYEEALAEAKEYFVLLGDREVVKALGRGYAQSGYRGAMRRAAETLVARSQRTYVSAWDVATLHLYGGEKDGALDWLEKAYQERETRIAFIKLFPRFDPLRDDPRFQDLLRRMNFPP